MVRTAVERETQLAVWTEKEKAAWRPKEIIWPHEWARKNIFLTKEMGVTSPGPYDPELTPWVKGIGEAYVDKKVEKISLVKAAQIGGTLTVQILICFSIDTDPSNILDFMDNDLNAKWASNHRIQPMIDGIPRLRDKVAKPRRLGGQRSTLEIKFDGGVLNLAGSNSVSQLSSKSAPRVFCDETGNWKESLGAEAGALELAGERLTGQYYFKWFNFSKPLMEGDPVQKEYEQSDKRKYQVPCPFCGAYQVLVWENFHWPRDVETGRSVSPEEAREDCWYECNRCGKKIREQYKRWMNSNGWWVALGQKIEVRSKKIEVRSKKSKKGKERFDDEPGFLLKETSRWRVELEGEKIKYYGGAGEAKRGGGKKVGFHLPRYYSPFRTWGQMAEDWLNIGDDLSKRQTFVNATQAQSWKMKTIKVDSEKLAGHIWKEMGPGVIPPGYDFITKGTDVQLKSLYYEVWAWRLDGASHLVEYGEIGPLRELGAVMSTTYGRKGQGEEDGRMGIDAGFIDTRYRTEEVERFCRLHANLYPCKGLTTPGAPRGGGPVSMQMVKYSSKGRKLPQALWRRYYSIHTGTFKEELMTRLEIEWDRGGDEYPPEGYVSFNNQTKSDFFKQLTAEERVEKQDIRGRVVYEWIVKSKMNHFLDGRVYAAAAFSFFRDEWMREKRPKQKLKMSELQKQRREERGR